MRNFLIIPFFALAAACAGGGGDGPQCQTKESCLTDPNCQCWCSRKCGFRKKEASDQPVYIENDRYGKHCYCNQWDYDHYEDNCVNGMNVQEPGK